MAQESRPEPTDAVLTIEELAGYLKISKSSLYKLVQEGEIPGIKIGRHWRFQKEVIGQWMRDKVQPGKGGAS